MNFETMKHGKSSVLPTSMDRHDVGMIEVGDDAGFGQIGFGIFGGGYSITVRHFDCNRATQLVVMGQINEAEATFAQDFLYPIPTDMLWQGGIDSWWLRAFGLVRTSIFGIVHGQGRSGA